ncbi:MAG: hypothetical protein ACXW3D_06010 [Caulobacteraceae bacterium]
MTRLWITIALVAAGLALLVVLAFVVKVALAIVLIAALVLGAAGLLAYLNLHRLRSRSRSVAPRDPI